MTNRLVLCYHSVHPEWTEDVAVAPSALRAQLTLLLSRGYLPSTFSGRHATRSKTLSVTFDDAFSDVYTHAFPVLQELDVVATVFVPTSFVDAATVLDWPGYTELAHGDDRERMRPMTWDQLGELAAAGWEIGSHSRTHPRLTTTSDSRLVDELGAARADCAAALGIDCRSIAYPYGDVDGRVRRATAEAGYTAGAGLVRRLDRTDPLIVPRVGVYRGDGLGRFRQKVGALNTSALGSACVLAAQNLGNARRLSQADPGSCAGASLNGP
jgi:peptidoglycan/xylan/chitin deacetylase (PgdA/CDA1 family)